MLVLVALFFAACGGSVQPSGTTAASPATREPVIPIATIEDAIDVAMGYARISPPWDVWAVEKGTFAEIYHGPPAPSLVREHDVFVWRVRLESPTGEQELWIEAATGRLVQSIWSGS